MFGTIDWDGPSVINERSTLRVPYDNRHEVSRNKMVVICDTDDDQREYLGMITAGPFFPNASPDAEKIVLGEVELLGELHGSRVVDTNRRPTPGSGVDNLPAELIVELLGCSGDMLLGTLLGHEDIPVKLRSHDKGVLPRNLGIFGTVGSGKSNTSQVMIEEVARSGWAVVVVDVEGEYIEMDSPSGDAAHEELLKQLGRPAGGVQEFQVYHPKSCPSDRKESEAFTLRLGEFEGPVIAELVEATIPERNALFECVDYFISRNRSAVAVNEREQLLSLVEEDPAAKLPFNLWMLRERASERSPRSNEHLDYVGLAGKLTRLMHANTFDEPNIPSLNMRRLVQPGQVSIVDVSASDETVQSLVTAAILRKAFAYKILYEDTPPTLLVIEEAHSFINKERVANMHATLQMLRPVTRRGRKRWLAVAFVSQQPGHLPAEIFELCNTRIVHNLRSLHNLEALMATAGDVSQSLWARCPLLGPGEALVSSPQLRRPLVGQIRPASSRRRFTK